MGKIRDDVRAFVVVWEIRGAEGAVVYGGARRVVAESAEDAEARARRDIAQELQRPPESIDIVEVTRM